MLIEKDSLDDLLHCTFTKLLSLPFDNRASRGTFSEITGAMLVLKNPLSRLSHTDVKGKSFSALGELLWYFSGSDKVSFIEYYIKEYKDESYNTKLIYGAYGPRLFNWQGKHNQIENVIDLLKQKPSSRRAVIQLFDARDIAPNVKANHKSIPCTCTLQFICRGNKLEMMTYMRSNDAFKGLPHDIYAFTMIQEVIASELNLELGHYKHCVGSLHLYEDVKKSAEEYLSEGYQSTKLNMPRMPQGSQSEYIKAILKLEKRIRLNKKYSIEDKLSDPYWKDIAYLLAFFSFFKNKDLVNMKQVKEKVNAPIYKADLTKKILSLR